VVYVVVVGIRPLLWYMYIVTEPVPATRIQMSENGVVHHNGSCVRTTKLRNKEGGHPTELVNAARRL